MKTLLLMRHAKSSWKDLGLPDRERPLNKRGSRDAPRMGKLIKKKEIIPDHIMCSTAKRARSTAKRVVEACGYDGEIELLELLYGADPEDYFHALNNVSDEYDIVMIIGHNPTMEAFLQILSDEIEALPTGALAQIVLKIQSWKELDYDTFGKLKNLWTPRSLKD